MQYKKLTVVTNRAYADILSLDMIEAGSEGTAVVDAQDVVEVLNDKRFWDYYDASILSDDTRVYVSGFFDEHADLTDLIDRLTSYGAAAGALETNITAIDSADYENEWKKYYRPIEIGKVAVVPKWLSYGGSCTPVLLDPGMAFGTGSHETTAMCIELMQTFDLAGKTVYDVGCGSGILGITAAKLGAAKVVLSDIDDNAVRAARANIALNDASVCEVAEGDLFAGHTEPADAVIANITADVLLRLKNLLKPLLKPCGLLVISGIIHMRAEEIRAAFGTDFRLVAEAERGEWRAFAYTV